MGCFTFYRVGVYPFAVNNNNIIIIILLREIRRYQKSTELLIRKLPKSKFLEGGGVVSLCCVATPAFMYTAPQ
jgi:hypothetical protein